MRSLNSPTRSLSLAAPLALALAIGCSSAGALPNAGQPDTALAKASSVDDGGPVLRVSSQAHLPTQSTIADLVEHVAPTVVSITTTRAVTRGGGPGHPFEMFLPELPRPQTPRSRTGAGTGFIVDGGGYVVTNAHVVEKADQVKVRLRDDREFTAEVIGRDSKLDLALLQIAGAKDLPSVLLGDSDALRVGEQVLAVGNPFGLGHTVTLGIVSAKARTIGAGPYDEFIQTDASINPGNSGGPLFNLRGEVVGINTAIRAGADGIGFAIPIDVLKDVMGQLKTKGYVERGKLGLMFQPITSELAAALGLERPRGALVNEVQKGGAAERAGIRPGDVIVAVGGEEIHRSEELPRNVARNAPGTALDIVLLRKGKKMTVQATLDKLEESSDRPNLPPKRGSSNERDSMMGMDLDNHPEGGVRIVRMHEPIAGLRVGDAIVEVAGKPVSDIDALQKALSGERGTVLVKVRRGDRHLFVGISLDR